MMSQRRWRHDALGCEVEEGAEGRRSAGALGSAELYAAPPDEHVMN